MTKPHLLLRIILELFLLIIKTKHIIGLSCISIYNKIRDIQYIQKFELSVFHVKQKYL